MEVSCIESTNKIFLYLINVHIFKIKNYCILNGSVLDQFGCDHKATKYNKNIINGRCFQIYISNTSSTWATKIISILIYDTGFREESNLFKMGVGLRERVSYKEIRLGINLLKPWNVNKFVGDKSANIQNIFIWV